MAARVKTAGAARKQQRAGEPQPPSLRALGTAPAAGRVGSFASPRAARAETASTPVRPPGTTRLWEKQNPWV